MHVLSLHGFGAESTQGTAGTVWIPPAVTSFLKSTSCLMEAQMFAQPMETALTSSTTPSSTNHEPITYVRHVGDDITETGNDSPGNGVAVMLGVNVNGAARMPARWFPPGKEGTRGGSPPNSVEWSAPITSMLALQSANPPDPRSGSASNRRPDVGGVRRRSASDLEVIIPAFNEAGRLPLTLRRTVEFLGAQPWRSRVVVVDNGSADDTTGVVWKFTDGLDSAVPVEVVGCARPGKGAAVRRGLLSSTSRFVGFFDADLATPVETLTEVMGYLQQGTTAVIASRHVTGASLVRPQPLVRRIGGAAFRVLARALVHGVHDTQCGFKFFERDAVMRALVQCQTTGFAFDVELLQRIQRDGGSIAEIPVSWTDDTRSTFHPIRDGIASFGAVLQMARYQP